MLFFNVTKEFLMKQRAHHIPMREMQRRRKLKQKKEQEENQVSSN